MNEPTARKPLEGNAGLRYAASVITLVIFSALLIAPLATESSAYPAALIPSSGAYFGAFVGQRGAETKQEAIARIEGQIGRKLVIDHQYYKWDTPFPTYQESWAVGRGMIPLLNWKAQRLNGETIPWSAIASGSQDDWIIQRADAVKAFGSPVYLTFHHEPEDDLATWGTPTDYAAAFRHIVTLFRSRDVANVAFVWTMMSWTFDPRSGRDPNGYYPGDSFVDLIGVDGFNWYPGRANAPWESFQQVFQPSNAFAVVHNTPWMAVETGVQEDPAQPGRKGQWLRDIPATAKGWPLLKAVIYFDTIKEYAPNSWNSDSSVSSTQGYAAFGADPYFNPLSPTANPTPSPEPASGPTANPTPSPEPASGPTANPTPSPEPASSPALGAEQTASPTLDPEPTTSPSPPSNSWLLTNSLDGGIAGQGVTSGNSGGDAVSAFDSVVVQGNASLVYDDLHARGGVGLSARYQLSPRSNAYYEWNRSFGTQREWFGRVYVWFDAPPIGGVRLVRARGSGSLRLAIDIHSSGQLAVRDSFNHRIATMAQPIMTRRWVRIEWSVDQIAGQVEVRLFNSENASSPTGTATTPPRQAIGPNTEVVQVGRSGTQPFATGFWTDDPAVGGFGLLGPA